MRWLHYCSAFKIPFYIYKLQKGDAVIYAKYHKNDQSIIILHGTIYLFKIFTNKEKISLAILNKNDIISIINNNHYQNHYYKAIALEETYIISFKWHELITTMNNSPYIVNCILTTYQKTFYKYELMSSIIMHTHIKNRMIQLILILCQEFGYFHQKNIIIPFDISQKELCIIIGTNKITIHKIIKLLCRKMLITYTNHKRIYIHEPFILNYLK